MVRRLHLEAEGRKMLDDINEMDRMVRRTYELMQQANMIRVIRLDPEFNKTRSATFMIDGRPWRETTEEMYRIQLESYMGLDTDLRARLAEMVESIRETKPEFYEILHQRLFPIQSIPGSAKEMEMSLEEYMDQLIPAERLLEKVAYREAVRLHEKVYVEIYEDSKKLGLVGNQTIQEFYQHLEGRRND
jgi:hypothetical protein